MNDVLVLLFSAGAGSFLTAFICGGISVRKAAKAARHPHREIYRALGENNRRKWQREQK